MKFKRLEELIAELETHFNYYNIKEESEELFKNILTKIKIEIKTLKDIEMMNEDSKIYKETKKFH